MFADFIGYLILYFLKKTGIAPGEKELAKQKETINPKSTTTSEDIVPILFFHVSIPGSFQIDFLSESQAFQPQSAFQRFSPFHRSQLH